MSLESQFYNYTADGSVEVDTADTDELLIVGTGTWGSGTLKVQIFNSEASTYQDITDASWTADFSKVVTIGTGNRFKIDFSGSSGADLDWYFQQLRQPR
jgi:hypothetical protein